MMAGDGGGSGGNMCRQYVADCSGKFHYRKSLTASMKVLKNFRTLKTRQMSMKNVIKMLKFFQVQNSFQA